MTEIKFGGFEPDQPASVEDIVSGQNVYPRTAGTYGPVSAFSNNYSALGARCQGAFYSVDSTGNTALWAGTASVLYKLSSGVSFSDVKKVGGYTTATDEVWEFEQFGTRVIATNFADPIQVYVLGSSALFADLSAGAPKAKHCAVVANFLMLGNTNDGTFGLQTDGLWWSAINDPTSFPTPATSAAAAVQSGRVNISGKGGAIQRIVSRVGTLDAVVVQEKQISRCVYVGTPDVFQFQPMEGAKGTPAPQSVVGFGGLMYYLGEDGFYANDGTQSVPIGAGKVDKYFFENVQQNNLHRVWGVVDPVNKLYIVAYPSLTASGGNPDRLLMYNYISQRWAPPTVCSIELLTRLGSVGYTLEDLDAFGTMDSITTSLDSRFWMGDGKPVLSAFDTSHRAGTFSGDTLEAILETGDTDGGSPRLLSGAVRPLLNGTSATVTAAIGHRSTQNEAVQYSDYKALNRNQEVPIRINDRHLRFLVKVSAGSSWEHLVGVDAEAVKVSDL
jgi:hypothetical protein